MADPKSRDIIGKGIKENRSQWFIQGHIGSTWKDEESILGSDHLREKYNRLVVRHKKSHSTVCDWVGNPYLSL